MNDNKISTFALACITINCVLIKLFGSASAALIKTAGDGAITAVWLSTAAAAIIFCSVYRFRRAIYSFIKKRKIYRVFLCTAFAYFVCSAVYTLYQSVSAVHTSIYQNMPIILILAVIAVSAFYIGTRDGYSIARLHGICVPIVVYGITAVTLSGIKYIDVFNAAPIFGSGLWSAVYSSLKHLTSFSGIILPAVFIILSADKPTRSGKSPAIVILISAIIGILLYSTVMTVFFLTLPSSAFSEASLPLGYLSEFSTGGRLGIRTDAVYTLALIESTILYVSSALHIAVTTLKKLGFKKRKIVSSAASAALILLTVFTLTGCYDSREVEDTAFVIAIGVDPGGTEADKDTTNEDDAPAKALSYTFQFSNPLATGENTNTDTAGSASSDDKNSEEGNETVDNVKVEADNIFEALNRVTNYMGKTPSIAHLKLLVLSDKLTDSGKAPEICTDLLKVEDVRPEASVCAVRELSALNYLTSVKPSLEDSTARHYELMFDKDSTFDSVQTDLRTFTFDMSDEFKDAHLPIVNDTGFNGTMLFSGKSSAADISPEDSRLINILLGNVKKPTLFYTDESGTTYRLKQSKRPQIQTEIAENGNINSSAKLTISAEPVNNTTSNDAKDSLNHEINDKLNELADYIYSNGCDILEIGKTAKASITSETEANIVKISKFSVDIATKILAVTNF